MVSAASGTQRDLDARILAAPETMEHLSITAFPAVTQRSSEPTFTRPRCLVFRQ